MLLEITRNEEIATDIYQMDMKGDFPYSQVQPGQFLHIRVGSGLEHVLRRPISIAEVDSRERRVTIVFRVAGQGTKWLSQQSIGTLLDVLGPLGRGFELTKGGHSLIVGGGIGIPPLYELAKRLAGKAQSMDIFLGFRSSKEMFWVERFAKFGNVKVFTDDGSVGNKGFASSTIAYRLSQNPHEWDSVYACGPKDMLKTIQGLIKDLPIDGGVSLEERMACGVGACYACTCQTTSEETKRICLDGPVFGWREVKL